MSYLDYLAKLDQSYFNWCQIKNGQEDGLSDVNEMMQAIYPGPYVIVEKYSSQKGRFALDLEFENPADRTLFVLRWS